MLVLPGLLTLFAIWHFFIGGSLAWSQDLWLFDSLVIFTPVLIRSFGRFSLIYWPDARLLACSLDWGSLGRMMCELGDGRRTTQPSEKLNIDADKCEPILMYK